MEYGENERRVWQRVLTQQEAVQDQTMIYWAQEDAAAFQSLWERTHQEQAHALWEAAKRTLSCLYGIRLLSTGRTDRPKPLPLPMESIQHVLEQAYNRCVRQQRAFTSRMADPRFGVVFVELARRQEENAASIAAWLGGLTASTGAGKSSSRPAKR